MSNGREELKQRVAAAKAALLEKEWPKSQPLGPPQEFSADHMLTPNNSISVEGAKFAKPTIEETQ